jgi:hypothetical protein
VGKLAHFCFLAIGECQTVSTRIATIVAIPSADLFKRIQWYEVEKSMNSTIMAL